MVTLKNLPIPDYSLEKVARFLIDQLGMPAVKALGITQTNYPKWPMQARLAFIQAHFRAKGGAPTLSDSFMKTLLKTERKTILQYIMTEATKRGLISQLILKEQLSVWKRLKLDYGAGCKLLEHCSSRALPVILAELQEFLRNRPGTVQTYSCQDMISIIEKRLKQS